MPIQVAISHPTDRPNFSVVAVGPVTLWFSYRTCVAVQGDGPVFVSENLWGPTTGKHLNYIQADKSWRMPRGQFERTVTEIIGAAFNV